MNAAGPYRAPRWLRGAHAQTIYPSVCLAGSPVAYRRERWDTPDGDFVDVDWIQDAGTAPLVLQFHGLEGSSQSHYARALMRHVGGQGWNGAVVHFRGCSGEPNRLARAYHSGDYAELDWILRRAAALRPWQRVFAVGVSLGGNALLKWLARNGTAAGAVIDAAAAVSAPLDLVAAGDGLARGVNRLYTEMFLRTLKRKSLAKLARHPGLYDAEPILRARTLRAFDDIVTAPLHGFLDAQDYWTRASSLPDLHRIATPTLLVHARNDPFLPGRYLPGAAQLSASIEVEFTEEGGHCGFVSGRFPGHLAWLPHRLLAFFRSV